MHITSPMIIRVARDEDLFEQIGKNLYFDLVDHDRVCAFHVQRETPFSLFKKEVAQAFGLPVQLQRFWKWTDGQSDTYRPDKPLSPEEESKPVGELKEVSDNKKPELNLFLEIELGPDHRPVAPPVKTNEDILLFFKLYDPEKEELRYVGRLFVKRHAKSGGILGKLNEMAGFRPYERVDLYEEMQFKPFLKCVLIDGARSFQANRFGDGGIICFQKNLDKSCIKCRYPTVPSFFEHKHACQEVEAQNHEVEDIESEVVPSSDVVGASPSTYYSAREGDELISDFNRLGEVIGTAKSTKTLYDPKDPGVPKKLLEKILREVVKAPPDSDEVESAIKALKEYVKGNFKLEMKEEVASVLSTLTKAETGLSEGQKAAVLAFWSNFGNFFRDYVTWNYRFFEVQHLKLKEVILYDDMEENHRERVSCKGKLEKLSKEEEELKKKMEELKKKLEETRSGILEVLSDWKALTANSIETESKYISTKEKLLEAEKQKEASSGRARWCCRDFSLCRRAKFRLSNFSVPICPSLDELKSIKGFSKECTLDLSKLNNNMEEKLVSCPVNLPRRRLSPEQSERVLEVWVCVDNIFDYLPFQHNNSEYELQKLKSGILFSSVKKNREMHISCKESLEKLAKEEKLKTITEERMSRLAIAWSSLHALLL